MYIFFFLMIRRPPRSTLCQTLFPYTTLFRSVLQSDVVVRVGGVPVEAARHRPARHRRSEEHTSELQSPDTISYAVFCLKKKKKKTKKKKNNYIKKTKKKKKIKKIK